MKWGEPRLDIVLLDDISVFAELAELPNQPCYTLDARHEKTLPGRTPYYDARLSEKGRYLSGLLDLFGVRLSRADDDLRKCLSQRLQEIERLQVETCNLDSRKTQALEEGDAIDIETGRRKFHPMIRTFLDQGLMRGVTEF